MTVVTTVLPAQPATGFEAQREHGQDLVSVNHLALRVDRQAPVGVAVVRDTGVGAVLDHGGRQGLQMRGATVGVDVLPVGLGTDRDHVGPCTPQQHRGQFRGGTVRAVNNDAHARQRRGISPGGHRLSAPAGLPRPPGSLGLLGFLDLRRVSAGLGGKQVSKVALALPAGVTNPAKAAGGRACLEPARLGQPRLDLVFSGVRQLEATPCEQLDPVVRGRVVAGRQHDAKVGAEFGGEVGDPGVGITPKRSTSTPAPARPATTAASRKSPEARGSRPTTATRREPIGLRASTRSTSACLLQQPSGRGGEVHGQLASQILACDTPNAIRPKEPAHETLPHGRRALLAGNVRVPVGVSAWSTAAPSGPSSARTSCAP